MCSVGLAKPFPSVAIIGRRGVLLVGGDDVWNSVDVIGVCVGTSCVDFVGVSGVVVETDIIGVSAVVVEPDVIGVRPKVLDGVTLTEVLVSDITTTTY